MQTMWAQFSLKTPVLIMSALCSKVLSIEKFQTPQNVFQWHICTQTVIENTIDYDYLFGLSVLAKLILGKIV